MGQSQCVPVFRFSLCASFNPLCGGSTGPVKLSGLNLGCSIWNSTEFLVKKISVVQAREIDNRGIERCPGAVRIGKGNFEIFGKFKDLEFEMGKFHCKISNLSHRS